MINYKFVNFRVLKVPILMKIMNTIQNLIQETFDHHFGHDHVLFVRFGGSMKFDDVL